MLFFCRFKQIQIHNSCEYIKVILHWTVCKQNVAATSLFFALARA